MEDNAQSGGEEEKFMDNWNYRREPHNTPLLRDLKRNHTLPKTIKDTVNF